jgi:predicted Zn-dependent peptidase
MNYPRTAAFLLVLLVFAANFSFAQTTLAPTKQEKLLNGLKVLIWSESKAEKVSLRLRVHSGAAFDPKDKMGAMALLADILFPDEQTRRFFEEDLEGSLEVTSNYDYIQINATAKADDFLTILETISTAVVNPSITPENFVKVRDARLKSIEEMQKNPAYVADMAVAKRLLGDFPYGRPQAGTPESVKLIERADLLTAKDKFFTADNATLVISGSVKPDFAYMAARRMFGAWRKADKLVPATFRQPEDPSAETLHIESPVSSDFEARAAFRGLARNDKDYFASQIFVNIMKNRSLEAMPANSNRGEILFRQEAHLLPGLIVFGLTKAATIVPANGDEKNPKSLKELGGKPITDDEFNKAKARVLDELNKNSTPDMWLDVDTFKLVSVKDDTAKANNVTLADVQRVATNLMKNPAASVLLNPPTPKPAPESKPSN